MDVYAFQIWLAVSVTVLILAMWGVVVVRYMRDVRRAVEMAWFKADEKFRKRHDLVPGLIEMLRLDGGNVSGVERLITARNLARRESFPGAKKAELEKGFEQAIGEIMSGISGGGVEFLEYKSEIREIAESVKIDLEAFNKSVEHHNLRRRTWWLLPICKVMRYNFVEKF